MSASINVTIKLLPHQLKALSSKSQIAGIAGSRALGKTYYLSVEALMSLVNGERCIIFAQTYKALTMNIFAEIMKRCEECGIAAELHNGNNTITFGKGIIFGFTYDSPDTCRGATEIHKLLLDELFYAPADILAIAAPCLRGTGKESKIRFASSPRKGSFWNRWIKENQDVEWWTGKMADNTFLSESDIELAKKAIKDPNMYKQEILGEILDDTADFAIVLPTDYTDVRNKGNNYSMGIDCAGYGADNNAFVVTDGCSIIETELVQVGDTFSLSNIASNLIKKYNIKTVNIDITGSTVNGLYDILKLRHGENMIHGINFAQKAIASEKYANSRAEMYMNLADKIRNGFYIDDNDVKYVLGVTQYSITNTGKILLQPKAEIKEIIGHSPDLCDALALSLYNTETNEFYTTEQNLSIAMRFISV